MLAVVALGLSAARTKGTVGEGQLPVRCASACAPRLQRRCMWPERLFGCREMSIKTDRKGADFSLNVENFLAASLFGLVGTS